MLSQLHGGTQMFIIFVPSCILYILIRRKKCFKIHDIILISLINAGK